MCINRVLGGRDADASFFEENIEGETIKKRSH